MERSDDPISAIRRRGTYVVVFALVALILMYASRFVASPLNIIFFVTSCVIAISALAWYFPFLVRQNRKLGEQRKKD